MKPISLVFCLIASVLTVTCPSLCQTSSSSSSHDSKPPDEPKRHVEFGPFVDYYRYDRTASPVNFVGLGGRVGFYVNRRTSLEAEMAYDFEQAYSTTSSTLVVSRNRRRPLHGLFGPKFDFGTRHADFFVTGKLGFVNFSSSTRTPANGFTGAVTNIDNGNTPFALYPGGGAEGFWGFFGVRVDVGDEIYFSSGTHNNLRVTFGPQFRF